MDSTLCEKLRQHALSKLSPDATAVSFGIMRAGQVLAEVAVGTLDGHSAHPAKTSDLYSIGSISKVYCTAAVMVLVEQGKLELDAPVVRYLPRFTMLDPRYRDITVRQTVCHSSGLPGTHLRSSFGSAWIDGYYDEVYDYFAHSMLMAAPGTYSVYCNDGFTLAEMIVAEVSGMPFSDFVRTYITLPIGAYSTCCSDRLPSGYDHVSQRGSGIEYLMVAGAGGINTNIPDLLRFGDAFLRPKFLSAESIAEMGKMHGVVSVSGDTMTPNYGLGWDCVNFSMPQFALGDHVLLKSGGTSQFLSFLVVSPALDAVFGISSTCDCACDALTLLLELAELALREACGVNISVTVPEAAFTPAELPAELQRYAGFYVTAMQHYEAEFAEGALSIYSHGEGERKPEFAGLRYGSDGHFHGEHGEEFYFTQEGELSYLMMARPGRGMMPFAQKPERLPPLTEKWRARDGKRYLPLDTHPADVLFTLCSIGAQVNISKEIENLALITCRCSRLPGFTMDMPTACDGDDRGLMFLQGSASASRDQFAPVFFTKDGFEHLYFGGVTFIDAAAALPVSAGRHIVNRNQNALFTLPEGCSPLVLTPFGGRTVLLDRNFKVAYDSALGGSYEDVGGGYLILCAESTQEFEIVLR